MTLLAYGVGVAWLVSLATVDGWDGIGRILDSRHEYLDTARSVSDASSTLHEYIDRIPYGSPDSWPVHVAGHPPGALLFFVLLVALGLGSGLAAGWVVLLIAATTPVAVTDDPASPRRRGRSPTRGSTPRARSGRDLAGGVRRCDVRRGRRVGTVQSVQLAATSRGRATVGWALLAGLLLGYCVMLSYGLPLLGLLALAVLYSARNWRPLVWAAGAALAVVLAFAIAGFSWWEAYPVLHDAVLGRDRE